jgi:hypothetical protein
MLAASRSGVTLRTCARAFRTIVIAVWFRVSSEPFPHGTNEMFALHETLIIKKAMLAMVRVSVKTLIKGTALASMLRFSRISYTCAERCQYPAQTRLTGCAIPEQASCASVLSDRSLSMQSGSLYRGEFIFGETGVTLISASRLGSMIGSSPESQGSKPSGPSITGMRVCKSRMPPQASHVRMVQDSMPSFQRSQSPAKVKGRPSPLAM